MAEIRSDSWAAKLTPDQQWELYCRTKQRGVLPTQAIQWAVAEFGLDKPPSRSSFYRWAKEMDAEARRRRLADAVSATAEAVSIGKNVPTDEQFIAAFKIHALTAMANGDLKTSAACLKNADIIHAQLIKDKTFDLARRRFKMIERAEKREHPAPNYDKRTPEEIQARTREIFGIVC